MTTVLTGKYAITAFHLLQLKYGLKLEILGLRHSRGSVYAYVKREFGFKGNKKRVLAQLEAYIAENFPPPPTPTEDELFEAAESMSMVEAQIATADEAMEQAREDSTKYPNLYE